MLEKLRPYSEKDLATCSVEDQIYQIKYGFEQKGSKQKDDEQIRRQIEKAKAQFELDKQIQVHATELDLVKTACEKIKGWVEFTEEACAQKNKTQSIYKKFMNQ